MANTLNLGTNGNWATKKDSLLAYNSENGNFKPLPFDFDRASSATRVNKDGLIETVGSGEPRIDYKDDSKGALLLEPSRSNLVPYSQDFSNSAWNTSSTRSVDFVPTSTIDPQGKTNAYRITSTASDNQVAIIGSIISGQTYTNSIYVRRVSGSGDVALRNVNNQATNFQVSVDDGWKRIETSVISTSTFGRLYINLQTVGDVIEIWGGQLEAGNVASSYIPTQGGAVTRVAESCNGSGNSQIFNDSEGVLMMEINTSDTSSVPVISLSNGTLSNEIEFAYYGTNQFNFILRVSGGTPNVIGTVNASDFSKFAVAYTTTDFKVYLNGVLIGSNSLPSPLSGLNTFDFNLPGGANHFYGNVKQIQYFNTALTDQELINLTTI